MAVIDRYLEALTKHRGEALVLRAGAPVQMVVGGTARPATNKPVSEEQVMQLLLEALGNAYAPGVSGKRTYPYQSPLGPASLQVEDGPLGFEVRIVMTGAPGVPGASPAAATMPGVSMPAFTPAPTPAPVILTPTPVLAPSPAAAPRPAPARPSTPAVTTSAGNGPGHIDDLFHQMMDLKASDMHLKSASQPMLRIDGSMALMPNRAPIQPPEMQLLLETIMPERNRAEVRETNDTDFAY